MTSIEKILKKFCKDARWGYRFLAFASMSYDELVAVVAKDTDGWRAEMAGLGACAWISSCLGATNMKWGSSVGDIERLYDRQSDLWWAHPRGPLFDHCVTAKAGRRVVGVITRPYWHEACQEQASDLAADPAILLWSTASDRCSWLPGSTRTVVLTRPEGDLSSLGFERL